MTPEESKELKELIEFLKENNIGEFSLERGELKVHIKFGPQVQESQLDLFRLNQLLSSHQALASPGLPGASAAALSSGPAAFSAEAAASDEADLHIVKSPIVGTFYESPAPGAPAFVKVGDQVENGQILCIVEAMKLMNEIESDAAGEIVKRFVSSGQPVEYGQPLFSLRRR